MRTAYMVLKVATGAACLFEAVTITMSIVGGPDATISRHVDVHKPVGLVILAGLAAHFYWRPTYKRSAIRG